jgi:hypothetical protein
VKLPGGCVVEVVDVVGTDVDDTDVLETDVLGTDVLDTDVLDTDVLDTDVLGTDVLGVVVSVARAGAPPSASAAAKVSRDFILASLSCVVKWLIGPRRLFKSHATALPLQMLSRASRMRPTSRENSPAAGGREAVAD